jgi:hypothetical protein
MSQADHWAPRIDEIMRIIVVVVASSFASAAARAVISRAAKVPMQRRGVNLTAKWSLHSSGPAGSDTGGRLAGSTLTDGL